METINSFHPVWGATFAFPWICFDLQYFNPRSPWGERRFKRNLLSSTPIISIHAPRGGSDPLIKFLVKVLDISIHAPRGGSDVGCSVWKTQDCTDFNPRSPWGERQDGTEAEEQNADISIHAPRGGSDVILAAALAVASLISIHAPRGGSDYTKEYIDRCKEISIHAPRGGERRFYHCTAAGSQDFNPRSPWGERPHIQCRSVVCH